MFALRKIGVLVLAASSAASSSLERPVEQMTQGIGTRNAINLLLQSMLDAETGQRGSLLTGNEAQGMPAEYAAACDLLVKIPMLGKADSLNAAVAAAVMAYEVLNQRRN